MCNSPAHFLFINSTKRVYRVGTMNPEDIWCVWERREVKVINVQLCKLPVMVNNFSESTVWRGSPLSYGPSHCWVCSLHLVLDVVLSLKYWFSRFILSVGDVTSHARLVSESIPWSMPGGDLEVHWTIVPNFSVRELQLFWQLKDLHNQLALTKFSQYPVNDKSR